MKNEYPIRILHVVQRMESAGLQSFIMNIYRNIDKNKIQFDFLVHYEESQFYDKEIEELGGKIYKLSFREDKNIVKYIKDLKNFFRNHAGEYSIIHGHMDSLGFIYLYYAKKYNIKIRIAHAHTYLKDNSPKKILRRIVSKLFKKNATILLACSERAGRSIFGDAPFIIIKNPIDYRRFKYDEKKRKELRNKMKLSNDTIFGNVGRLTRVKNQKFVIDIFNHYLNNNPNSKLFLIGSGELKNKLKKYVDDLGISSHVLFIKPTERIENYYQVMDLFVFPSLYEGLGIACIEAQACGLPTFTSDTVPKAAKISDIFFQISLKKDAKQWSDIIIEKNNNITRRDKSLYIKKYGYDIDSITRQLMKIYEVE